MVQEISAAIEGPVVSHCPTIGGRLDYRALANLHRPREPQAIAAEIRRLAASGLKAADIATALNMAIEQVRQILAEPKEPPG
jgi:hypothetical protein